MLSEKDETEYNLCSNHEHHITQVSKFRKMCIDVSLYNMNIFTDAAVHNLFGTRDLFLGKQFSTDRSGRLFKCITFKFTFSCAAWFLTGLDRYRSMVQRLRTPALMY